MRTDHVLGLVPPTCALIVNHFSVGNENALPPGGGKLFAQSRVFEKHEVRLIETADGLECVASKEQARSREPVDSMGSGRIRIFAISTRKRVTRPNADQERVPDPGNKPREFTSRGIDGSLAVAHKRPEGSAFGPGGRGLDKCVDRAWKKDDVGIDHHDPLGIHRLSLRLRPAVHRGSVAQISPRPHNGSAVNPPDGVDDFASGAVVHYHDVGLSLRGRKNGLGPQRKLFAGVEGDGDDSQVFGAHWIRLTSRARFPDLASARRSTCSLSGARPRPDRGTILNFVGCECCYISRKLALGVPVVTTVPSATVMPQMLRELLPQCEPLRVTGGRLPIPSTKGAASSLLGTPTGTARTIDVVSKKERDAAHMESGRRPRHIFRIAGLCLTAILLTGVCTVAFMYVKIQQNIEQYDPDYNSKRPTVDPHAGESVNFLLIGSDYRSGESDVDGAGSSGDVVGMRSDTTMLVHISSDRKRVEVVSIPRDTLVDIPECKVRDKEDKDKVLYKTKPQKNVRFNSAFASGGAKLNTGSAASCTISAFEKLSGYKVRVDNFVVVNFASFKGIVNTLGGVPVYFPDDVNDKEAGLKVKAGCRLLDGDQALALARARKSLGDGSDLGRVGRQQELVKTILLQTMELDILSNVDKLYGILKTTTKNVETNKGFGDIPNLVGLGSSLQNIAISNVKFMTMPFEQKGSYVVQRKEASKLWESIQKDKPVTMKVDPAEGTVTDTSDDVASSPSTGSEAKAESGTGAKANPAAVSSDASTSHKPSKSALKSPSATSTKTPVCTKENAK